MVSTVLNTLSDCVTFPCVGWEPGIFLLNQVTDQKLHLLLKKYAFDDL